LERRAAKLAANDHRAYVAQHPGDRVKLVSLAPNVGREHLLYHIDFYRDQVHNQIPMVHPNDAGRRNTARQLNMHNWCDHRAGECDCVVPSVYVGTHVLYYVEEQNLVAMLAGARAHTGYFIVLSHEGIYGLRKNAEGNIESTWQLDGDGYIHEKVQGNLTEYVHKPLSWVARGGFDAGERHCVVAELVEQLGDTKLVKVTLVEGQRPVTTITRDTLFFKLGLAAPDPGTSNWVQTTDEDLRRVQVHAYAVLGEAALLRVETGTRGVVVSRAATAKVAAMASLRVRTDPALFDDAVHYARGVYKEMKYPPQVVERAVTYTALLGLVSGVREETDIMMTIRESYSSMFRVHALAVRFGSIRVVGMGILVSAVVASVILWSGTIVLAPQMHHLLGLTVGAVLLTCWSGLACCLIARNRHMGSVGASWTRHASRGAPPGVTGPTTLTVPLLYGHAVMPELPPMREDARLSVLEQERRKHPSKAVPRSEAVGMMVPDHVPLVIEPTLEAEVAGLRTRVLKAVPKIREGYWANLLERMEVSPKLAPCREARYEEPRELWKFWTQRQKVVDRVKAEKAKASLSLRPLDAKDYLSDAFLKMEKTPGTVTRGGAKGKKPRVIQADSDRLWAFLGPAIWWAFGVLKKLFDGSSGILFASSRNADVVGEFVRGLTLRFKRPLFLIADRVTYDCSLGQGFKQVMGVQMFWMGLPLGVRFAALHSKPEGRTVHGARYSTEDGMRSGQQWTSDGGSEYNAVCVDETMYTLRVPDDDWGAVILGDDLVVVVESDPVANPRFPDDDEFCRRFVSHGEENQGLVSDSRTTVHVHEVKFASHLFVPIKGGTWRLSPMPGRVVAKLGSRMTGTVTSNLAADVNSVWQDAAHVPFLNTLLRAYKRLLRGVSPRGRPDEWDHKIHAPSVAEVCEATWQFITARYSLTREDDASLEEYLGTVQALPCVVQHRVLTRLMEVDLD